MPKKRLKSVVVKQDHDHGNDAKWLKHYSSTQQILSVGDGDFSFSLCLATAFGSASNIIATSLDTYNEVIRKYRDGKSNIEKLKKFGACVIHGVDATKMMRHADLKSCKFDRIVFSFPHAGFHGKEDQMRLIRMHRSLLSGFFKNASRMLRHDGEVHVNHKTTQPYRRWNLKELASCYSLSLAECTKFILDDYPGYTNKRGDHPRCDETFQLGESSTYKFITTHKSRTKTQLQSHTIQHQKADSSKHPVPFSPRHYYYPGLRIKQFLNDVDIQYVESIKGVTSPHCAWFFGEHLFELFGRAGRDVTVSLHEDLQQGYNHYMAESPKRTINGYLYLLCELQRMRNLESRVSRLKDKQVQKLRLST